MHHLPSRYIPCDGRLTASAYFKSTLPAWGATRLVSQQHCCCAFQSTLPAGERQSSSLLCVVLHYISTHTPRMGSDRQRRASDNKRRISIHAPRMGSDNNDTRRISPDSHFNPRSPHGERPDGADNAIVKGVFQSTLPAWGATPFMGTGGVCSQYFNPRSPHGERLDEDEEED